MTIFNLERLEAVEKIPCGCVVALGFFDGVHLGHRLIIDTARREALLRSAEVGVWTISIESGDFKTGKLALTDEKERLALLGAAGADFAAVCNFSEIRDLNGEAFVRDFLKEKLRASVVVCGYNYRFGKGAACGVDELREMCTRYDIGVVAVDAVTDAAGEAISSTRIRAMITDGNVEEADLLLGRPYGFSSVVLKGKKLGRKLGFPTANQLVPKGRLTPLVGVYAVSAEFFEDGRLLVLPGAANVGYCPTLTDEIFADVGVDTSDLCKEGAASEGHAVCETYIVGYNGDLYGREIRINFLRRLRGETKFSDIEALKEQIRRDAETSKMIHEEIYGSSEELR